MEQKNQLEPTVQAKESFLLSPTGQEIERFNLLQREAMMYASSTIVPTSYRGKDNMGNIIIAMDMAKRLNANLLMIMQNLNVIAGRPSWSAKFLISTVNCCGRFNPIQYKFEGKGMVGKIKYNETVWDDHLKHNTYIEKTFNGESTENIQCIAYTTRKGSDEVLESSPVDIKTAILEGWYTKRGSKWRVMPRMMLMYRAASWWTNVYAPDLSMGLMTTEEAKDIEDADYEEIKTKTLDFNEETKTDKEEIKEPKEETKPAQPENIEQKEEKKPEPQNADELFGNQKNEA